MNYKLVGFLRGLGVVVLLAVLSYVGNATNISFIENHFVQGLIVAIVAAVEHSIEENKGKALFGAIQV